MSRFFSICLIFILGSVTGGTQPIDPSRFEQSVRVDHVGYRAAVWETEHVHEPDNENPNHGGFVRVYLTNISDEPVRLRNWIVNRVDRPAYLLSGRVAWDRKYRELLAPGQMTIVEFSGISDDFAPGKPFEFAMIDGSWRPCTYINTTLEEDDVQISFIQIDAMRKTIDVHLRHTGTQTVQLLDAEVVGHERESLSWVQTEIIGEGQSIATLRLADVFPLMQVLIVKLTVETDGEKRTVFAHRRAFSDAFPIGTWSNNDEMHPVLYRHHIDTMVRYGSINDPFYTQTAQKYGFRSLTPTELHTDFERIISLRDSPVVHAWLITDEPDWSTPAAVVKLADDNARRSGPNTPTFITLCRNVKFFHYAMIPDIPCQDHYCVSAPSSSEWPYPWGTRLEETAYYTHDLKIASEPKPIWIWTQGIADWSGRPKRTNPNEGELAAQLLLNLGRGAKGILWFNFDMDVAERYPDAREGIQRWGRVLSLTRDAWLRSEPIMGEIHAPDQIDVAALVSKKEIIAALTDIDYEMRDDGYRWEERGDFQVTISRPEWIQPKTALLITPDSVTAVPFSLENDAIQVEIPELLYGAVLWITSYEDDLNLQQDILSDITNRESREILDRTTLE